MGPGVRWEPGGPGTRWAGNPVGREPSGPGAVAQRGRMLQKTVPREGGDPLARSREADKWVPACAGNPVGREPSGLGGRGSKGDDAAKDGSPRRWGSIGPLPRG